MRIKFILSLFLAFLFIPGCKDDEPSINDLLIGSWKYTDPFGSFLRDSPGGTPTTVNPTTTLDLRETGSFSQIHNGSLGNRIHSGPWEYSSSDGLLTFFDTTSDCSDSSYPDFNCELSPTTYEVVSVSREILELKTPGASATTTRQFERN